MLLRIQGQGDGKEDGTTILIIRDVQGVQASIKKTSASKSTVKGYKVLALPDNSLVMTCFFPSQKPKSEGLRCLAGERFSTIETGHFHEYCHIGSRESWQ